MVVLGWQQHPDFPLIVAANRDEFHGRPTARAHWWSDAPDIVGGRDLQAGGSWLALHRNGRFATVTNFRDAELPSQQYRSRGHLVTEFLASTATPAAYLSDIDAAQYAGFNLLVSDGSTLAWLSNHGDGVQTLPAGIYGLSNALLDSPWHKVERSKAALGTLIRDDKVNETELFRLLGDRQKAPADAIESDQLPFAMAHAISAIFIVLPDYGTRSSSIALLNAAGTWRLHERCFNAAGKRTGDAVFTLAAQGPA